MGISTRPTYTLSHLRRAVTTLLLAILLTSPLHGEDKVVDRSAKKTPEWLTGPAEGFLVVTVEASTVADAQKKALNEVTERIIHSIASNVSVTQTNIASEVYTDGTVRSTDSYSRTSNIRSANLPFLKGISLSKASDIYWVRLRDKKSGAEHYEYSVKYPFSRMDQRMLEADFDDYDKAKEADLQELENGIDNFTSIEDIRSAIVKAETLEEYFFDNVRAARVKGLKTRYNDLYKSLGITGSVTSPGVIECALTVGGRAVRCGSAPAVTSNCASNIRTIPADGAFRIEYDTADCIEDEDNYINVSFRINGKKTERKFSFGHDEPAGKFSVVPQGTVYLTADTVSTTDNTVSGIEIRLTLNNRGTTDFGVKSLELNVPGLRRALIIDDIDAVYTSRGNVTLKCRVNGTIAADTSAPFTGTLSGRISLVNPLSGSVTQTRIALPYAADWQRQ